MLKPLLLATGLLLAAGVAARADIALKLGVLNDRSGVYVDISGEGSVVAARMAVEDFHAADKGMKVDIVSADHQNKPDIGANIARQWYDQDGVDAIFDVPTSSVALAVSQVTREKNKVFMDSGAGASTLTGAQCSPNTVHWTYDTYALAKGTATEMVKQGGKSWFFLTADYAFGHALQTDAAALIKQAGGEVVGSVNVPFPSTDVSSFLLQAQGSGANVVALANAGGDTVNAIKQSAEFGLQQGGQKLAGLLVFISDVHALGLQAAQGLLLTSAFYWDLNDDTRAWAKRYAALNGGKMPGMGQAGVYSSIMHYLKAVDALKSKDATAVMAKMKAMPIDDPLFGKGSIRADGRALHAMYLFQVKTPAESKGPWDYYTLKATIPAEQAFRPMQDGDARSSNEVFGAMTDTAPLAPGRPLTVAILAMGGQGGGVLSDRSCRSRAAQRRKAPAHGPHGPPDQQPVVGHREHGGEREGRDPAPVERRLNADALPCPDLSQSGRSPCSRGQCCTRRSDSDTTRQSSFAAP